MAGALLFLHQSIHATDSGKYYLKCHFMGACLGLWDTEDGIVTVAFEDFPSFLNLLEGCDKGGEGKGV